MIIAETYIKKDNTIIQSIENIQNDFNKYFVKFKDIKDLKFIRDYDYIEGALIINYNGRNILGFKHWDLIDQLWSYIIDAIQQVTEFKTETYFYFPDQPIKFNLELISKDNILLSIDNEKQLFNKSELIVSLLNEAKRFWEIIKDCSEEKLINQSQEELKKIYKILSFYDT